MMRTDVFMRRDERTKTRLDSDPWRFVGLEAVYTYRLFGDSMHRLPSHQILAYYRTFSMVCGLRQYSTCSQ